MVGTLPSTYYVIEYNDKIIGQGDTIAEAYQSLTNHYFEVKDDGRVYLNRRVLYGPSYLLKEKPSGNLILGNEFTKEEALKDWFRCYARRILPYKVHRCLRDW
jgi:hypothetical protein